MRYHADTRSVELIQKSCVSNSSYGKQKKPHGEILCEIAAEFIRYLHTTPVKVIVRERAISKFAAETMAINKVVGVVDAILFFLRGHEFQEITAGEVRKCIVGYGTAGKDILAGALGSYFEHPEFKNFDESDACGVALGWLIQNGYMDGIPHQKSEDAIDNKEGENGS